MAHIKYLPSKRLASLMFLTLAQFWVNNYYIAQFWVKLFINAFFWDKPSFFAQPRAKYWLRNNRDLEVQLSVR